jgi:PAS domain S-box-containing protein
MAHEAHELLQQALLGEAIDSVDGVAVFVWNEERHYVAVNQEACRLVGLEREELIGMPVGDLSPDGAAADMRRVQAGTVTDGTSSIRSRRPRRPAG